MLVCCIVGGNGGLENMEFQRNVCCVCAPRCGKATAPSLLVLPGLRFPAARSCEVRAASYHPCPGCAALSPVDVHE